MQIPAEMPIHRLGLWFLVFSGNPTRLSHESVGSGQEETRGLGVSGGEWQHHSLFTACRIVVGSEANAEGAQFPIHESMMYKERYGGSVPTFGNTYWFYPQLFRYLDERGVGRSDIFSVLEGNVTSKDELKSALIRNFPQKRTVIEQGFGRYGN